jgi:hypothetical protein
MRLKQVSSMVIILALASAAAAQASMKGYELYSWKRGGTWYYSLLPGTNRTKTYEEITAQPAVKKSIGELESELKKLSRGAQVFWQSDAPPGVKRPASGSTISFKQPSRKRIMRIKEICDELGIMLKLT